MPSFTGPLPDNILKCMPKESRPKNQPRTTAEVLENAAVKLERDLHKQIESWLSVNGIAFGHARMDRKSTYTEGWPDFTFAINGIPIAIECKRDGEVLNDEQRKLAMKMAANGWRYYVVTDFNWFYFNIKQYIDVPLHK